MIRGIVHIQIGQAGNQISNEFWNTISKEHKLNEYGKFKSNVTNIIDPNKEPCLDKINVFYQEVATLRYVPRAILIDTEPGTIDTVKASPMGKIFKPDNFCFGASSSFSVYVYTYCIYILLSIS